MFQSFRLKELKLPVNDESLTSMQRVQVGLMAMVTLVLPPTLVPMGISTGFVPFIGHWYSFGDPIMALAVAKKQEHRNALAKRSGNLIVYLTADS